MARTRNARGGRRPRRKTAARKAVGGKKRGTRKSVGGKRRGSGLTRRARGVRRGGKKGAAQRAKRVNYSHLDGSGSVTRIRHSTGKSLTNNRTKVQDDRLHTGPNTWGSKTKPESSSNRNPKWAQYIALNLPSTATPQQKFDSWAKVQLDMATSPPPTTYRKMQQRLTNDWDLDNFLKPLDMPENALQSFINVYYKKNNSP